MGCIGSRYASTIVRDHDLHYKVSIVTGPISGIGYETAKMLASVGCHVVLAGRGQSRLARCASEMTRELSKSHPDIKPQLTCIELDLTSFASIHAFFTQFQQLQLPCHYLFNNAGVMMPDYGHTAEGFELQMGINCMGHGYLTNLLLSILISSSTPTSPSRVIFVSSELHQVANYDVKGGEQELKQKLFPKQQEYSGFKWYGNSKLGNIYQAREITRRYGSQGVISLSCHPGVVPTEIGRATWSVQLYTKVTACFLKSKNQGAATSLWIALDDEWPKHIHEPNFPFYSKECHLARTKPLGSNQQFGRIWYDFAESEITRAATKLGLPLGISSSSMHQDEHN